MGRLCEGRPPASPIQRLSCEPTEAWNLEVLESTGRGLPALEMEQDSKKVGRAIAQASTPAQCARANSMFVALKDRALKDPPRA